MTETTYVCINDCQITVYSGPSSWPDVQFGVYFDAVDVAAVLGRVVPPLPATRPDGVTTLVLSSWTLTEALDAQGRKGDWREVVLAIRQADQAFGNVPAGHEWVALI